jgi:transposase
VGDWVSLREEIEQASGKLSCYEAGRGGFWIYRELIGEGMENQVLDSVSIEVGRRKKKVKTDRMDVVALLRAPGGVA